MSLRLPHAAALRDWQIFAERARRAEAEAAMRLSIHGSTLVLSCAPLYPAGLGDTMPLTLGMRMLPLTDSSADGLDAVVPIAALLDRFARAQKHGSLHIDVPPQQIRAPWAGISPPRGGWASAPDITAPELRDIAAAGIAEIAAGSPAGSGAHAVARLRRAVWSRPVPGTQIPAGAAFALDVLGFLPPPDTDDKRVQLRTSGPWWRLSTAAGHVLTRPGD